MSLNLQEVKDHYAKMNRLANIIPMLVVLLLTTCQQQPQETERVAEVPIAPKVASQASKYLTNEALINYVQNASVVDLKNQHSPPFTTLAFNKVIAYDYEGHEEQYPSVISKKNGKYIPVILHQQALNTQQVDFLLNFLTDNDTYGTHTASCFIPHQGIVFYQDEEVKFVLDICLDCNQLTSTSEIPATQYHQMTFDDGTTYGLRGFSQSGQQKIVELSQQLGLDYGEWEREFEWE